MLPTVLEGLSVMTDRSCPDCHAFCMSVDGRWICPECLCRVTQTGGSWVAIPGKEADAARRHKGYLTCNHPDGHFWNLSEIVFSQNGVRLMVPIGRALCIHCGVWMDANDIYTAEEIHADDEDEWSGKTG